MTCMENTDKIIYIVWHGTSVHAVVIAIHVSFMVKSVLYGDLDPLVLWPQCNHSQWYGYYRTNIISRCGPLGVGPDCAPMLRTVCFHAMAGALALYYRSLGTASTLLRMGKISRRPYCWTMIIVYFICIYHYYISIMNKQVVMLELFAFKHLSSL